MAEGFIPEEFDILLFPVLRVEQQARTEAHNIEKDLHDILIGIAKKNFNMEGHATECVTVQL
jgi:hypothetical protein